MEVKGHLANLRPHRVRERLRNVRTVALDNLYGLPATSRMGRGKRPNKPKQLPRLLPVGEVLPLRVQWALRVVQEEQVRLSPRWTPSVQPGDPTNPRPQV